MHVPSRRRARFAVLAAVAVAATAVATTPAFATSSPMPSAKDKAAYVAARTPGAKAALSRSGSAKAAKAKGHPTKVKATQPARKAGAASRTFDGTTGHSTQGRADGSLASATVTGSDPTVASAGAVAATATDLPAACDDPNSTAPLSDYVLWSNYLSDRWVVHLHAAGADHMVLQRQREGGALTTVATLSGDTAVYKDATINPDGYFAYVLTTYDAANSPIHSCSSPVWLSSSSDDGYGWPDAVAGLPASAVQQGIGDWGDKISDVENVTPTFSTDGRLIASSQPAANGTDFVINVTNARTGAAVFTVALPAGKSAFDAAFSRDGQTLAFGRYDSATGDAEGLSTVPVHGAHTIADVPTNLAFALAEPTWLPDGRIVADDWNNGSGLYTTCATCTAATLIPGTAGGLTPQSGPDGTTYFGTAADAGSTLSKVSPAGVVTVLRTAAVTGDQFYWPRLSPDGQLYVAIETTDPTDSTVRYGYVNAVNPDGTTVADDTPTDIGIVDGQQYYLEGYDVRQPLAKGLTQFIGDAHGDLLARTGDYLYAYTGTWDGNGVRKQLGRGWSQYNAIVSVGDVTSDDRADMFARDSTGTLWLYKGRGNGTFYGRIYYGKGWGVMTMIGASDVNGDDIADLLARDNSTGTLWLYPGTGSSTFGARTALGRGWNGMDIMTGTGDITFDNTADLLVREKSTGTLWLYPGKGNGVWGARRAVATNWGSYRAIVVQDLSDQRPLLESVSSLGELQYRSFSGDGTIDTSGSWSGGYGWNTYTLTS